jgi:hypothetical protein
MTSGFLMISLHSLSKPLGFEADNTHVAFVQSQANPVAQSESLAHAVGSRHVVETAITFCQTQEIPLQTHC